MAGAQVHEVVRRSGSRLVGVEPGPWRDYMMYGLFEDENRLKAAVAALELGAN